MDYVVTEGSDEYVQVCVVVDSELQRDGVIVSLTTQDALAIGELV